MTFVVSRLAPVAALALLVLAACRAPEPLRFGVTFEDAGGVKRGNRVVHRGLEVGKVTRVGIDDQGLVLVSVEVEDRFRGAVARNSIVRIERYGIRRRVQLNLQDSEGERIPLTDGDVLKGSEGVVDDLVTKIQDVTGQVFDRAAEEASTIAERLRTLPDSPEIQDFSEALRLFGEETAQRSREGWTRWREEELPRLRERAEAARRQLEESGMLEEAEELRRDFESWLEKTQEEAPAAPP